MPAPLKPPVIATIRRLKMEGLTIREISEQLGMPYGTVGNAAVGVPVPPTTCANPRCGRWFDRQKASTRFCSPRCRNEERERRLWRERNGVAA